MTRLWILIAAAGVIHAQNAKAPDAAEQRELLDKIARNAIESQEQLPDFVCTQLTRRGEDPSGKGKKFKLRDTLEVEFTFVERHPNWKLLKVNGKPARSSYDQLRSGFISDAILQFFSLPGTLFGGDNPVRFEWKRRETANGRQLEVFAFRVTPSASHLAMSNDYGSNVVGFHGFIYADPAMSTLARIEVQLELPRSDAVRESSIDVDYGLVTIAERQFLLPVKAVARLRTSSMAAENETDVVRYQKYSADSSVKFGEPAN